MFSYPFRSVSFYLIFLSVCIACIGFCFPSAIPVFGLSSTTLLYEHNILQFGLQVLLFQFLHGGIIHLLFNMYFLYIAGPTVEARMTQRQFLLFFITTTLCITGGLLLFEKPFVTTIGISGFCMALLAYLCLDLFTTHHPLAFQIAVLLILNISLGLFSGISFYGHFVGALAGAAWWYFGRQKYFKK